MMKRVVGSRLPVFSEEESDQVRRSSDFVGVIHYTTLYVTESRPTPSILPSNQSFSTDMNVETICKLTCFSSISPSYPLFQLINVLLVDSHWELCSMGF